MLLIKSHYDDQARQALLDACLQNLCYDPQCESIRIDYLINLIAETGEYEVYKNELVQAVEKIDPAKNYWDFVQIFSLLCRLAQKDKTINRDFLNKILFKLPYDIACSHCSNALIELNGISGLENYLKNFGQILIDNYPNEHWTFESLLYTLIERDGAEQVNISLENYRQNSPELDQILEIRKKLNDQKVDPSAPQQHNYQSLKQALDKKSGSMRTLAKSVSTEDFILVANDLLAETDEDKMRRYLMLFQWRDFPLTPSYLFPFVNSSNNRISSAAQRALGKLRHKEIRDFAFGLYQENKSPAILLRIIMNSSQTGDIRAVEASLKLDKMTEDDWHGVGMALLNLVEQRPSFLPESQSLLLNIYKNGPCSLCRYSITEQIILSGYIEPWLVDECKFDCDKNTQQLFSK